MKTLTQAVIAALALSFGATAFAQTSTPEITRAEVHAQLVQAERDGLLPAGKNDYPPSPIQILRNREAWAAAHHDGNSTTASVKAAPLTNGVSSD